MTARRPNNTQAAPPAPGRGRLWWPVKNPTLRFGLTFAALMAAYYAVAEVPFFDRILLQLLQWNAAASAALLNLLGQHTHTNGTVIRSVRFATNVQRGCDAVEPAWFFAAAVLAFPAPWKSRLKAIAMGTLLIGAINVVRIATLFLIGAYWPRAFAVAHLELWPAAIILLASGLWIAWLIGLRRESLRARA